LAELSDGAPDAAAATLRSAISGPLPKSARVDALVGLGRALDREGNREGAVAAYAEAIASGATGPALDEATVALGHGEPRASDKSR
jgi:TolA-binding protein